MVYIACNFLWAANVRLWLAAMAIAVWGSGGPMPAKAPEATISNGEMEAHLYLPDAQHGYYRGTRFDWSGAIHSLTYKGHDFYGPWYSRTDPAVHDFVYDGDAIVAGPCSGITGPVEEFQPLGFNEAKAGGTFVKIGVGLLRRPDEAAYDAYRVYEIVDGGRWTATTAKDSVSFVQKLSSESGYGYVYTKTVRLVPGKPQMTIEHRLQNIGTQPIATSVYDHNFLTMDRQPPGAGLRVIFPFTLTVDKALPKGLAEARDREIVYLRDIKGEEVVAAHILGFGSEAKDYDLRIESSRTGTGIRMRGDRPIQKMGLWSIRSVIAVEPFIGVRVDAGGEFVWGLTYDFYTTDRAS